MIRILLAVAVLCIASPAAATSILLNSGFETGDLAGWQRLPACQCQLSAFGVGGPSTVAHGGLYLLAFNGDLNLFLINGSEDAIAQTVETVPGQRYDLSFWLRTTGNAPPFCCASEMRVQWNGTVVMALPTIQPSTMYVLYTLSLLAIDTTSTLRLGAMNLTGATIIDDVSLEPSAVPIHTPEPAAFGLLAFGLLCIAFVRHYLTDN